MFCLSVEVLFISWSGLPISQADSFFWGGAITYLHTFHLLPLDAAVGQHLEGSPGHGGHFLLLGLLLIGAAVPLATQAAQAVHQMDQTTAHQALLLTPTASRGQTCGGLENGNSRKSGIFGCQENEVSCLFLITNKAVFQE